MNRTEHVKRCSSNSQTLIDESEDIEDKNLEERTQCLWLTDCLLVVYNSLILRESYTEKTLDKILLSSQAVCMSRCPFSSCLENLTSHGPCLCRRCHRLSSSWDKKEDTTTTQKEKFFLSRTPLQDKKKKHRNQYLLLFLLSSSYFHHRKESPSSCHFVISSLCSLTSQEDNVQRKETHCFPSRYHVSQESVSTTSFRHILIQRQEKERESKEKSKSSSRRQTKKTSLCCVICGPSLIFDKFLLVKVCSRKGVFS